jgi:hypothetical protein
MCKNAVQKPLAMARNSLSKAADFQNINACANNHYFSLLRGLTPAPRLTYGPCY